MQTSLQCIHPCEKKISPHHSFFPIFFHRLAPSMSLVKNIYHNYDIFKRQKILLFTLFLRPRTLREITVQLLWKDMM